MLVDDDVLQSAEGRWTVTGDLSTISIPPTIHALLDCPPGPARARAAGGHRAGLGRRALVLVGRGLRALARRTRGPGSAGPLQSLVRKELIEPDRSEIRSEDAFRFTHILVRDAAYQRDPEGAEGRDARAAGRLDRGEDARPRRRVRGDRRLPPRAGASVAARARSAVRAHRGAGRQAARRSCLRRPASARSRAATCRPPSTSSPGRPRSCLRDDARASGASARARVRADGDRRLRAARRSCRGR